MSASARAVSAPAGFKTSEVGLIPDDWNAVPLGKHASFKTGPFGSLLHRSDYVSGGIPVINPMQIMDGKLVPTDSMAVSVAAAQRLSAFRLSSGDLVIGRRGEMGRCALVIPGQDGWICGTGSMIVCCRSTLSSAFLQRVLSSPPIVAAIESASVGTTMINLNNSTLSKLLVPLPSTKTEQEAIAEALGDADASIESVEQLIAKKRQIKQSTVQELLSGKRRLPGYIGDWEEKFLGDLGTFLKGSGVSKDSSQSGLLRCVRYGELYTRHNDHVRAYYSFVSPAVASGATRLQRGDILFAASGETKEEIGKCAAFVDDCEAYAGGDIVILRTREADPAFLGYYLNTEPVRRQKASRGQGDAVVHIGASALGSIRLTLPRPPEQSAIAAVLLDMDSEIEQLTGKLFKARSLKQAMMQELLTGRVRLV